MLAIANEHGKITISFLVNDLPAQDVEEMVTFLKADFLARQSHLSENAAFTLSEQMKADWWAKHAQQILAKTEAS